MITRLNLRLIDQLQPVNRTKLLSALLRQRHFRILIPHTTNDDRTAASTKRAPRDTGGTAGASVTVQ